MKNFKPTKEILTATRKLISLNALKKTIEPIVIAYQTAELEIMQPLNIHTGKIIVNPKQSYLMSDEDFSIYNTNIKERRAKAGFTVADDDHCPLLVVEDDIRKAERVLCDLMKPFALGIGADEAICSLNGLENYRKLVNLHLSFLVQFVSSKAAA